MTVCDDMRNAISSMKRVATQQVATMKMMGVITTVGLVGALGTATGETWLYDKNTNAFYKSTGKTTVPYSVAKSWNIAVKSEIPLIKYDLGQFFNIKYRETRGIMADPSEFVCTDFARQMANEINGNGGLAYNVVLRGEEGDHMMIAIADPDNKVTYIVDPTSGIPKNTKTLTQLDINRIKKAILDPTNWKPIARISSVRDLLQIFKPPVTIPTPPKTIQVPSMEIIEPQDPIGEGKNTLDDFKYAETYAGKPTKYEIIAGKTREIYVAPGNAEQKSGDPNAVIPLDEAGYILIEVPDGSNIRTIDDLDTFGNIETRKYIDDKGLLAQNTGIV